MRLAGSIPLAEMQSPDAVLEALRDLATRAGIEVRIEPFAAKLALGKGGLCRVGGRPIIFVDAALGLLEQVGVVGLGLGAANLRGLFVPKPLVTYLKTGHGPIAPRPAPVAHLRPLARAIRA